MSLFQTLKFITSHPLNAGHPIKALTRYAWWQFESRLQDEVEFEWIEGSKLVVRRGMTGATGNIYCGLHEFADMAFVLHFLRPGDLFVDVGANIGSYTVLASAVCGARAIAIEPDPSTFQVLRRNVIANGIEDRVKLFEAAVGGEEGNTAFTVGRDTTNRVARADDQDTREVRVCTLDKILANRSPTCIKLDVEGYEAQAIKGGYKTLDNPSLHAVLIETVELQVEKSLIDYGFRKYFYDPLTRTLFKNSDSIERRQTHNALFLRLDSFANERVRSAASRIVHGRRL